MSSPLLSSAAPADAPDTRCAAPSRRRLWIELTALFVMIPVLSTFALPYLPRGSMYILLIAFAAISLGLLAITPGFRWRSLLDFQGVDWRWLGMVSLGTFAFLVVFTYFYAPDRLFFFLRADNDRFPWYFIFVIWALYPFLSALGQEVSYRALFFGRYGSLFQARWTAIVVNAALFSLLHLPVALAPAALRSWGADESLWEALSTILLTQTSWTALWMTFAIGVVWAEGYTRNFNFPQLFLAHSIGGNLVFTVGMGWEFCYGCLLRMGMNPAVALGGGG